MSDAKALVCPSPIPDMIRRARKEAGLTQTDAAQLVYSARRTWQDWEHGVSPMHRGLWELFSIKIGLPKA